MESPKEKQTKVPNVAIHTDVSNTLMIPSQLISGWGYLEKMLNSKLKIGKEFSN